MCGILKENMYNTDKILTVASNAAFAPLPIFLPTPAPNANNPIVAVALVAVALVTPPPPPPTSAAAEGRFTTAPPAAVEDDRDMRAIAPVVTGVVAVNAPCPKPTTGVPDKFHS